MEWLAKIPTEVAYVVIAAFGGTARYLQVYLEEGSFTLRHFVAHVIVSSFSGYMFYRFAEGVLSVPDNIVPAVAGMGGWMGVRALEALEEYIKRKYSK